MEKRLVEVARFTPNPKAAIEFYKSFFSLRPAWETEDAAEFAIGSIKVLVHKVSSSEGSPGEDHLAFAVDDIDAAYAELRAKGMRIEKPPHNYEWGKSAYLRDPDGRWLEIYQKK